ncbi:hypothetical protein [uncultured Variovorax sp.]|uniref:hypothetical protein n=1 Tax=uncultured Variovorax sp. TaxID=114708 RepID=UPI0025D32A0E|nr:hypothetical protein [uncultured Variovorax sp.]
MMKNFLENYVKEINEYFLKAGVVKDANSGVNDNGWVFYAYVSFYPQEMDLIIELKKTEGKGYLVVAEAMNQEGQEDEEVFNFLGDEIFVKKELNTRREELISKILLRLR